MTKALFICLCCSLFAAAGKNETPGGVWDARLYGYTGSVLVRPAGGKNWANARKGLPLSQGDVVRTGKKSSADISLDGRGMVTLNASTEFDLKTLKRKDSSFALRAGRLIIKITGLKARMERMAVRTPTAVAAVRGTEFGVDYSKDLAETLVNVFEEGQVEVTSLDENGNPVGETITVIPRHEVRVRKEMEAMSLAQSPASRYKDPGIFSVRSKLGALEKAYQPMDRLERDEEREQAFDGKGRGRTAAGYDEERAGQESQAGAYDRAGRKKGGAGGDAAAAEGSGQDGRKRGEGGYAKGSRESGEDGAQGGRYARDGSRKKSGDDGDDGEGGRSKSGMHRFGKGRGGDDDDGGGRGKGGLLGRGGKGGGGGGDGGGNRAKSGAAGPGPGAIAGGAASRPGVAGAIAGAAVINPASEGALSRPTSATDKSVGTIVSRVQDKLAATGNDGLISNSELRTLVLSAAKTSTSDASFTAALNASVAERIALSDTSSGQTGAAAPKIGALGTAKTGTLSSPVSLTNPSITSPVLTNSGSVNTGTVKKKAVVGP